MNALEIPTLKHSMAVFKISKDNFNCNNSNDNNPNRLAGRRLWDSERVLPDYYYFFFRKRKELMFVNSLRLSCDISTARCDVLDSFLGYSVISFSLFVFLFIFGFNILLLFCCAIRVTILFSAPCEILLGFFAHARSYLAILILLPLLSIVLIFLGGVGGGDMFRDSCGPAWLIVALFDW